jgi:hypothetical protein
MIEIQTGYDAIWRLYRLIECGLMESGKPKAAGWDRTSPYDLTNIGSGRVGHPNRFICPYLFLEPRERHKATRRNHA